MLGVIWNAFLDCFEGASPQDGVFSLVDLSILVIDLDLMEGVFSHAPGVDDKSSLSDAAYFLLDALFVVVVVSVSACGWEHWVWLANDLQWLKLSVLTDGDESPIIETTFPELAEVKVDFHLDVVDLRDVPLLDLVPSQKVVVVAIDWRWGSEAQEDLRIFAVFLIFLNDDVNYEMLANTSNYWPESLLQLPVNTVVEHVE